MAKKRIKWESHPWHINDQELKTLPKTNASPLQKLCLGNYFPMVLFGARLGEKKFSAKLVVTVQSWYVLYLIPGTWSPSIEKCWFQCYSKSFHAKKLGVSPCPSIHSPNIPSARKLTWDLSFFAQLLASHLEKNRKDGSGGGSVAKVAGGKPPRGLMVSSWYVFISMFICQDFRGPRKVRLEIWPTNCRKRCLSLMVSMYTKKNLSRSNQDYGGSPKIQLAFLASKYVSAEGSGSQILKHTRGVGYCRWYHWPAKNMGAISKLKDIRMIWGLTRRGS